MGFASEAAAQTASPNVLYETGREVTITVKGIPANFGNDTPWVEATANLSDTAITQSSNCGRRSGAADFCLAPGDAAGWNSTARALTFPVTVFADTATESDETFSVIVYSNNFSHNFELTFTIKDGLPPPKPFVSVEARDAAIDEGGTARFRLHVKRPAGETAAAVTVQIHVGEPTGQYSGTSLTTQTIPASATSKDFSVATSATTATELDSHVTVNIIGDDAYGVGTPGRARIAVRDTSADTAPTPEWDCQAWPGRLAVEGDTVKVWVYRMAAGLRARLPAPRPETVTVTIADQAGSTRDFVAGTLTRQVLFDHLSTLELFEFPTVKDTASGHDGIVTVSLPGGASCEVRMQDDVALTASFGTAARLERREADATYRIPVVLSGARRVDGPAFDLHYSVSGTATRGVDYTVPGTVRMLEGNSFVYIPVTVIDDRHEDSGETVVLTLTARPEYGLGTPHEVKMVLTNDDPDAAPADGTAAPVARCAADLPANAVSVAEVEGWRDDPRHRSNAAHVERWNRVLAALDPGRGAGTAMTASEAQEFADRGWSRWVRAADTLEAVETCLAATTAPSPVPEVSIEGVAAAVEGGAARWLVTLSAAPATALTVNLAVSEAAGSDFVAAGDEGARSVTVAAGHRAAIFTVTTVGDAVDEPDGSVTATLAAGAGYTVSPTANAATVSVADDDAPAALAPVARCAADLPANAVSVAEVEGWRGDRSGTAHVERWNRVLKALDPGRGSGTAMTAAEAQEFADKGWQRWVRTVETLEAIETCLAGTTPPPPLAEPEISIAGGAGVTEGGSATFTLTATPAPSAPLAVDVTVTEAGGYAAAGTHRVTIPTGGTAVLSVATAGDDADEPDGSVTATLAAGAGYTVSATAKAATVSVADDDDPAPAVPEIAIAAGPGVTEGATATFTLTANPAPATPLSVTLAVSEAAGSDFVAAGGEGTRTVTIPANATGATFTVATQGDASDEPDGSVTATLAAGTGYTVSTTAKAATVFVADDDAPAPAAGTPTVSISDAREKEGAYTRMMFTLTLSRALKNGALVYLSTRDTGAGAGHATAGRDYKPRRELLVPIYPGRRSQQVWVYLLDDLHDEGEETFELHITRAEARNARDIEVAIGDGVGVGTIVNDDPMPAAWLARFGRAVAEQALEGISGRLEAARTPGMQGSLGGHAIGADPWSGDRADAAGGDHLLAGYGSGAGQERWRTLTGRELLLGSRFTLSGGKDASGGSIAFWGRAAQATFDGEEGTLSLDGEVITGMLGADYARGRWLVGLALSQSEGEGGYRDSGTGGMPPPGGTEPQSAMAGTVESSLTAAIPYASLRASERLRLWGAAGFGTGDAELKAGDGQTMKADTDWRMAAGGLRGGLLGDPGGGPALAVTSDALWARTGSDRAESDVTRLRLGLEGSYHMELEGGASLTPKLELGARHDGGDAGTGFGMEVGGGVAWAAPALGLSFDIEGRTLVAHEAEGLEDSGFAASLAFDPDPATQRGPSLSLRQDFGGRANGGLDALFANDPLADRTGSGAESRWTAEAAYGFPALGGRFTASPHVGLGLSNTARDYTLGWRLTPEGAGAPDFSFGVSATRREGDREAPEQRVGFEIRTSW